MPILYEDDLFRVKNLIFGTWRVTDKRSGATVIPSLAIQERMGLVWYLVRKKYKAACPPDGLGERTLFQLFAAASTEPNGEIAAGFLSGTPEDTANGIIQEAHIRYAVIQELKNQVL